VTIKGRKSFVQKNKSKKSDERINDNVDIIITKTKNVHDGYKLHDQVILQIVPVGIFA
jgi:hypothetical protein